MDRNPPSRRCAETGRVALRKESVDRNRKEPATVQRLMQSLSARRAWIEITLAASITTYVSWSLSARRAWIEIYNFCSAGLFDLVALRKESVDRNPGTNIILSITACRSPQGERG